MKEHSRRIELGTIRQCEQKLDKRIIDIVMDQLQHMPQLCSTRIELQQLTQIILCDALVSVMESQGNSVDAIPRVQ